MAAAYAANVRFLAAFLCLLMAAPALAVENPSAPPAPPPRWESPYQLRLDLDLALGLGGIALWAGTSFVGTSAPTPSG